MNRIVITDPFTGLEVHATHMQDNSLVISTPFDGTITLPYDQMSDTYKISANIFRHRNTMTLSETAKYLGVSRMYVSRMCSDGTLKAAKINGAMVIDSSSVQVIRERKSTHVRSDHKVANINTDG